MNTIRLNTIGEVVAKTTSNSSTENSTGGGIPIVKSIEELEALNLPAGSVASVANNALEKKSIRDLYQPTLDDIDMDSVQLTNPETLSKVSRLEFAEVSLDIFELGGKGKFYLVPKTLSASNMTMLLIDLNNVRYSYMSPGGVEETKDIYEMTSDNTIRIKQESVDNINGILASDEWCYLGFVFEGIELTETDFTFIDHFVRFEVGTNVTKVFLVKPKDLSQIGLQADIESLELSKQNIKPVIYKTIDHQETTSVLVDSHSIYSIEGETGYGMILYLESPQVELEQYIIHFFNVNKLKIGDNLNILWVDGLYPTLDASCYYELEITAIKIGSGDYIYKGKCVTFKEAPLNA